MFGAVVIALACLFTGLLSPSSERTVPVGTDANAANTQLLQPEQDRRFRIVPEYERRMERIVVSISDADAVPEYHHELLSCLPDYTGIELMVPDGHLDAIKEWIEDKPYGDRVRLVAYDPQHRNGARLYLLLPDEDQLVVVDTEDYRLGSQHGTLWAQDLFEAATASGHRTLLLTACAHKCFQSEIDRRDRRVISDNAYLACLDSGNTEVQRTQLAFKGGNVLVDELAGKRLVFCGYDSVRSTRTVWQAFEGKELSDAQTVQMFQGALAADRIVLVGGARPQPELMYHLDQAMLLLADGVVGVAKVVGERPRLEPDASRIRQVEAFLVKLRPVLTNLGYTVVDIDTTVENVLKYQHYVNAIPYVDKSTGQRTLLMPVFPTATTVRDKEIIRKNTQILESLGYTVVHVPTRAYELTGGIHCLVNVLQ